MQEQWDAKELVKYFHENLWLHFMNHSAFETSDPQIMVEGKGCMIKDINGNEYFDGLSGGVWCVNVGYGRDSIADAVSNQMKQLPYYAGSVANPQSIMLAHKLASLLPSLPKVFISNSGSEANEKAFKMVRQYFRTKYPNKDKYKIVYRDRDYHGTTFAALSATGQSERRASYGPFLEGFLEIPHALCYRCAFGKTYPNCNIECARALEDLIRKEGEDSIGAVIVEPITAGGGIIAPVKEYYQVLQEICQKHEVLLIMDEVVNGFARTGKMFGYQHYEIDPDIVTLAKGMASSYMPISATLAKKKIFDGFLVEMDDKVGYFRDISTYGGCTGSCVAALENIKIMEEENLVENSATMGDYLMDRLKELESLPIVGEVRGKGLFAGIELVEDKKTKVPVSEKLSGQIVADVKAQGVLIGKMNRSVPGLNNVLTMAPPLIVTKEDIDKLVDAITNSITKYK